MISFYFPIELKYLLILLKLFVVRFVLCYYHHYHYIVFFQGIDCLLKQNIIKYFIL